MISQLKYQIFQNIQPPLNVFESLWLHCTFVILTPFPLKNSSPCNFNSSRIAWHLSTSSFQKTRDLRRRFMFHRTDLVFFSSMQAEFLDLSRISQVFLVSIFFYPRRMKNVHSTMSCLLGWLVIVIRKQRIEWWNDLNKSYWKDLAPLSIKA